MVRTTSKGGPTLEVTPRTEVRPTDHQIMISKVLENRFTEDLVKEKVLQVQAITASNLSADDVLAILHTYGYDVNATVGYILDTKEKDLVDNDWTEAKRKGKKKHEPINEKSHRKGATKLEGRREGGESGRGQSGQGRRHNDTKEENNKIKSNGLDGDHSTNENGTATATKYTMETKSTRLTGEPVDDNSNSVRQTERDKGREEHVELFRTVTEHEGDEGVVRDPNAGRAPATAGHNIANKNARGAGWTAAGPMRGLGGGTQRARATVGGMVSGGRSNRPAMREREGERKERTERAEKNDRTSERRPATPKPVSPKAPPTWAKILFKPQEQPIETSQTKQSTMQSTENIKPNGVIEQAIKITTQTVQTAEPMVETSMQERKREQEINNINIHSETTVEGEAEKVLEGMAGLHVEDREEMDEKKEKEKEKERDIQEENVEERVEVQTVSERVEEEAMSEPQVKPVANHLPTRRIEVPTEAVVLPRSMHVSNDAFGSLGFTFGVDDGSHESPTMAPITIATTSTPEMTIPTHPIETSDLSSAPVAIPAQPTPTLTSTNKILPLLSPVAPPAPSLAPLPTLDSQSQPDQQTINAQANAFVPQPSQYHQQPQPQAQPQSQTIYPMTGGGTAPYPTMPTPPVLPTPTLTPTTSTPIAAPPSSTLPPSAPNGLPANTTTPQPYPNQGVAMTSAVMGSASAPITGRHRQYPQGPYHPGHIQRMQQPTHNPQQYPQGPIGYGMEDPAMSTYGYPPQLNVFGAPAWTYDYERNVYYDPLAYGRGPNGGREYGRSDKYRTNPPPNGHEATPHNLPPALSNQGGQGMQTSAQHTGYGVPTYYGGSQYYPPPGYMAYQQPYQPMGTYGSAYSGHEEGPTPYNKPYHYNQHNQAQSAGQGGVYGTAVGKTPLNAMPATNQEGYSQPPVSGFEAKKAPGFTANQTPSATTTTTNNNSTSTATVGSFPSQHFAPTNQQQP
eukprot:Ihof_evm19s29 gene=Ihof_evmTU19s29